MEYPIHKYSCQFDFLIKVWFGRLVSGKWMSRKLISDNRRKLSRRLTDWLRWRTGTRMRWDEHTRRANIQNRSAWLTIQDIHGTNQYNTSLYLVRYIICLPSSDDGGKLNIAVTSRLYSCKKTVQCFSSISRRAQDEDFYFSSSAQHFLCTSRRKATTTVVLVHICMYVYKLYLHILILFTTRTVLDTYLSLIPQTGCVFNSRAEEEEERQLVWWWRCCWWFSNSFELFEYSSTYVSLVHNLYIQTTKCSDYKLPFDLNSINR